MRDAVKKAYETIERAAQRADAAKFSNQPRFDKDKLFSSFMRMGSAYQTEKSQFPYSPDSRKRDEWLSKIWKSEPHLSGVLHSVITTDKNRGWTLTGPQRQVTTYSHVLENADDEDWRHFFAVASNSYYTSDLGSVVEIGRAGKMGPMRGLYNVDPARCLLTGNVETPLAYFPLAHESPQYWESDDYFRIGSMPSTDEKFHRLGFCAVSRALELAALLMAVYDYDTEMLGARAPRGLMLLKNISESQWDDAMAVREVALDESERNYYGGVAVIAQEGIEEIDAQLVALSQLPAEFDRQIVTDQIMFGIALCFGWPADEFWPVQYGAIGRSNEAEMGHLRGSDRGGSDFLLSVEDAIQRQMPPSLVFGFEQRDARIQLIQASVYREWSKVAQQLYEKGAGVMDRAEVRAILRNNGILPTAGIVEEGAEEEGVETETGTGVVEDGARDQEKEADRAEEEEPVTRTIQIQRALRQFPGQPIYQYSSLSRSMRMVHPGRKSKESFWSVPASVGRASTMNWKPPVHPVSLSNGHQDLTHSLLKAQTLIAHGGGDER